MNDKETYYGNSNSVWYYDAPTSTNCCDGMSYTFRNTPENETVNSCLVVTTPAGAYKSIGSYSLGVQNWERIYCCQEMVTRTKFANGAKGVQVKTKIPLDVLTSGAKTKKYGTNLGWETY